MSTSKTNTLVDVTNNDQAKGKSTRNGGHANINLSEKAIELRKQEQALALEQSARSRKPSSVGGSKQPSKKQKPNEKGGKGSGTGSHENSQQNITDYHKDYRIKEGTNQERFVKLLALKVKKKQLKGLDESVKVKFRNFGGASNYVSLKNLVGVHKYLKMNGDFMDTYDSMTTKFGAKMHVLSDGYYVDQANRRAVLADKDSELIFELKTRVDGKLAVLDLATLTDAELATITECRGKEQSQHADHKKSMPQVECIVGDNEPVTTVDKAKALLKGGQSEKKTQFLTDMRLKLAKEFTKNPHAFMKDINSAAIKDTWTGKTGRGNGKKVLVTTKVVVRFSRPFTREDFR